MVSARGGATEDRCGFRQGPGCTPHTTRFHSALQRYVTKLEKTSLSDDVDRGSCGEYTPAFCRKHPCPLFHTLFLSLILTHIVPTQNLCNRIHLVFGIIVAVTEQAHNLSVYIVFLGHFGFMEIFPVNKVVHAAF